MPKAISTPTYTILHTTGLEEDISFQKSAWTVDEKAARWLKFREICDCTSIDVSDLGILAYNQDANFVRVAENGDKEKFTKIPGNAIITANNKVTLMAWAADCCLIGLTSPDGRVRGIAHASVKSLNAGIIEKIIAAFKDYSVKSEQLVAYIGACAGKCCYEYDYEAALVDFSEHKDFIYVNPEKNPEKVYLDLYGAVKHALRKAEVGKVEDIFDEDHRCTICAKTEMGEYMFPSYRREHGQNDQYGLVLAYGV